MVYTVARGKENERLLFNQVFFKHIDDIFSCLQQNEKVESDVSTTFLVHTSCES